MTASRRMTAGPALVWALVNRAFLSTRTERSEFAMTVTKHWTIDVFIGEDAGRTHAEVRLDADDGTRLVGIGEARLNPADENIPEIGDELAVARALTDLGHRLLVTAAADIQAVSDRPVHLRR